MQADAAPRAGWLDPAWTHLAAMRKNPAPAVLLVSPQSTDAHRLAQDWTRLLLCEAEDAHDAACGQCRSCREMGGNVHPDLLHLARNPEKRDITIDQIREAIDWAGRTARGSRRVLYIESAEELNTNASNAFLKTLEEPARGLVIVLSCRRLHALPITMRSRCQRVSLPSPGPEQFAQYLRGQGMSEAQIHSAVALAPGDVTAALNLSDSSLQQLAAWEQAWRTGVEQGDTLGAASSFDNDDWQEAVLWLQRKVLDWARSPGAAAALEPAWKAIVQIRAMKSIALNRLLLAEELLMLLRSAYRQHPPTQGHTP